MRVVVIDADYWGSVPRTRGDDPELRETVATLYNCSPHTRG